MAVGEMGVSVAVFVGVEVGVNVAVDVDVEVAVGSGVFVIVKVGVAVGPVLPIVKESITVPCVQLISFVPPPAWPQMKAP